MKRTGPTHFKTQRLMAALQLAAYEAVGILELLWHFADQHAQDGNLSRFTPTDIAAAIGWKAGAEELENALVAAGFLDRPGCCDKHRLLLHDRAEHAQDHVKKNVLTRQHSRFASPCPPQTNPDQSRPDTPGERGELTGNAALPLPKPIAEADSPSPALAEAEATGSASTDPGAPEPLPAGQSPPTNRDLAPAELRRQAADIARRAKCREPYRAADVLGAPPSKRARKVKSNTLPDGRLVDELAGKLAKILKIQHLDELKNGSTRWRQAKTDRRELVEKIAPLLLTSENGSVAWALDEAEECQTADKPMAVFKLRLKKAGVMPRPAAKAKKKAKEKE